MNSENKMALPPQQFCVRWNSYHTNLQAVFPRLLLTEQFADVTLACESRQLRCHKLVLSACSAYLERLLTQNPCKHPIVLMRDMRFSEMQALVDFMYKGEVNVTQEELPSLLKSAEALQIRGLCSSDTGGLSEFGTKQESKDYTVASEALVAHAQRDGTTNNGTHTNSTTTNGSATSGANTAPPPKKRKSDDRPDVKEETVEEDGLYYGELDAENMEYNEDEDSGKPGSSLGQASGRGLPYIRVKPESELFFQTKLQNLAKANSEYIQRLAKMNPSDIQKEFTKYGLTNTTEEYIQKTIEKNENDYYKSWLEQNGELEVSLLRASQVKKTKIDPKNQKSEVELIPKTKSGVANKEIFPKFGEKAPIRRRGRPPIFKDQNVDIGETVLKSDLDQFLEGKEVSSSGLSRKDLERVMMGKFNPNRRYSNEAMWAALMDVKKGGSIYRAAQTHKVPRKSLRNWMKRCHIKSSFPMPQQLKQFVENSKKQKEFKAFDNYPDAQNFDADFAIANVQCHYGCDDEEERRRLSLPPHDHTYDTRDEPPAFFIQHLTNSQCQVQVTQTTPGPGQFVDTQKIMTLGPGNAASVNVIHVGDRPQLMQDYNINKRIRRSEVLLRQAADCVCQGSTFQTVSDQFNIPISTIRFFMARKGILPRRRRGRSAQQTRPCGSPEPPFHMQHYKLPDMVALRGDGEEDGTAAV